MGRGGGYVRFVHCYPIPNRAIAGKIVSDMATDKISKNTNSVTFKLGVGLLIVSCLLWLSLVIIPFLPITSLAKTGLATSALIAGEVAFWLGAILTGKEFVQRYKKYFNPKNWKKYKN